MEKHLAWPVALATIGLTALSVVPAEAAVQTPVAAVQTQAAGSTSAEPGSLLEQARALLGPEIVEMATANAARLGLEEAPATTAAILKALDPEDYACSPNTPLTDWFRNHPLLSLNAYAFSGVGDPNPALAALPDQIVMGDGIMQAYRAIGLGDVAPQAILSHGFGHHVQYEDGLFESNLTGPEAIRRTELMADGFGAYFLAHSRGASMQWKRVQLFDQVFYGIGDCNFFDAGHHGTPNQRLRTAEWAYSVVTGATDQGHILPSLTFAGLFDAKLPDLVASDAGS